jgi:energy-coupling factor transport system substrate-specific component
MQKVKAHILLLFLVAASLFFVAYAISSRPANARIIIQASTAMVFAAPILAMHLEFEKNATSKFIALIASLTAVNVVLRQAIHGFGPTPIFYTVILAGYVFGPTAGFMVGSSTIVASNFFVGGHGPWTLMQMSGLGLIGFFASAIPKAKKHQKHMLAIYGLLSGIFYGLYTDVFSWLFFTSGHATASYFAIAAAGAPFTLSYGLGNLLLLFYLSKPALQVLERFKKTMSAEIINQK